MSQLEVTRNQINDIDEQIVALLNQRAQLAMQVGAIKRQLQQPELQDIQREQQVIDHLRNINQGPFPQTALESIYRVIMQSCLTLQRNG